MAKRHAFQAGHDYNTRAIAAMPKANAKVEEEMRLKQANGAKSPGGEGAQRADGAFGGGAAAGGKQQHAPAPGGGQAAPAQQGPAQQGPAPEGPAQGAPQTQGEAPQAQGIGYHIAGAFNWVMRGLGLPELQLLRKSDLDNAAAQEVLTGVFGNIKPIVQGNIQILDQAGFQAAYDAIYGASPYSWAAYVVPNFGNLNGFADNGTNYINKTCAGLHTVVHEMLHNNVAGDWRGVVGHEWDEGTTEVLTIKACQAVGEESPICYPGQTPCVREALAQGLSEADLVAAYLSGGAQAKIATWADTNCTQNWAAIKANMEAKSFAAVRAGLQHK